MATNFLHEGGAIPLTAPVGGVTSGGGVLIGKLFVVAAGDADAGASFEGLTSGVFTLPKTSALAIDPGDLVYWDAGNGVVNKTADAQKCVGVAVSTAVNPSSTVSVFVYPNSDVALDV